jgi:hypothetical protein
MVLLVVVVWGWGGCVLFFVLDVGDVVKAALMRRV